MQNEALSTYTTLLARLVELERLPERLEKLVEECYELSDAACDYQEDPSSDHRVALIDEMADVRILLDELSILLGDKPAQTDFLLFKLTRQLCRHHKRDPKWCASHPDKDKDLDEPFLGDPIDAAQEAALEVSTLCDDLAGRQSDAVAPHDIRELADAMARAYERLYGIADRIEEDA